MKYVLTIIVALLLSSCSFELNIQSLKESQQNGYSKISDEQKDSICFVSSSSKFSVENNSFIYYAISGQQLYDLLNDSSITIIYDWSSYCSSESCIPISLFRMYCEQNNYKCIIISVDYDVFNTSQVINDDGKIYFINHFYYNEEYSRKCLNKFSDDFMSNFGLTNKKVEGNRFWLLRGKEVLGFYRNIEEIESFLDK